MGKQSGLLTLILLFMALGPLFVPAQSQMPIMLRVRLLDSHTHKPLSNRSIQLTFTNIDGDWIQNGMMLKGRTGKDGVATFNIGQPISPRFSIFVWYGIACFRKDDFSTKQILDQGIVAGWADTGISKLDGWCAAEANATRPVQSPGEAVIFVHPQNRFVWAWEDTWR
jgi:hypothetical protein